MKSVLIIADIEGSTGCSCKSDSQLFNNGWVKACVELTHDLNAIVDALLKSGRVDKIRIKDFHRTGFNIFSDILDKNVELSQGYEAEPVTGIGDCKGFDLLYLVGLHAASGTDGFLPHTLTSKFSAVKLNDQPLSEAELFSASVAKYGLKPVFFSGCGTACQQARSALGKIKTVEVAKPLEDSAEQTRSLLAKKALEALDSPDAATYFPEGEFKVEVTMRDGDKVAETLGRIWELPYEENRVFFHCNNLQQAYDQLIKLAYLKPFYARHLKVSLRLFNLWGRLNYLWARQRARKKGLIQLS
jgi:D-aminopeptidase